MPTPIWQPGKLYLPGAIVQPRTPAATFSTAIVNPGFESGAAGWTLGAGVTILATGGFSGPQRARFSGTGGQIRVVGTKVPVSVGTSISAACMYAQGAADSDLNVGRVTLTWYDASSAIVREDLGTIVRASSGGSNGWKTTTVTGIAPEGATQVAIGCLAVRNDGEFSYVDAFTWNYSIPTAPAGLIFKAVQPAAGLSATAEPAWPLVVGVQVVDNEVIWEGVLLNRVVWRASPSLRTTGVEPVWPTDVGEVVADGAIKWRTASRRVEDPNCPNSKVVTIAASKIYAADDDIVKYSATVNPLDWSTRDDAGFLPTGLQQYGANPVTALGLYRGNLVPFNAEAFQMWQIDEDPANSALLDALPVGTTQHHALSPVSNDLLFLSSQGVRSVGISGGGSNLKAADVGTPIDPIVRPFIASGIVPMALYYPAAGQYWLMFPHNELDLTDVMVYTISQIGQVGAWSRYVFPYKVTDWAIKGDVLFLRSADRVFEMDDDGVGDQLYPFDGETLSTIPFTSLIQWPYLDFGPAGVTKMVHGFDIVSSGLPAVSFGYDQTDFGAFTESYPVPEDTVPGQIIPMPISAPSIAVRITFAGDFRWEFSAFNLHMEDNRVTA